MSEVYELDAGDYKYLETSDWIQNDGRGNINLDWEKWFNHEKSSLNSKVKKQLEIFKTNILKNTIGNSKLTSNFLSDFTALQKELNIAIDNAKLGSAAKRNYISVAENLRTNEIDSIQQALTTIGFDNNLLPDGNIKVSYYDKDNNYTPKDSWTVKNDARASFITHNETGLTLKLDRNGLSFIDDKSFKINNRIIDYESIYTPRNVNFYPTGDEFDPLEDYDGPAYDAQTQDRDIPRYEDIPGRDKPAPGRILPEGEETVQDLSDYQYEQALEQADIDAENAILDAEAEQQKLNEIYGDPLDDYDGPAYDAQTMDRDIPIYEDVAENIDKQTGTPGIGVKALDVVGKVFGPVDEIVMKSLSQGLPKLFAGTALAGVMGGAGAALAKGLAYWSASNLALAVVKGAGTFAAQYGGDTTKAIDAILDGEIPAKTFEESVKESFGEGMQQFTNQMQYDPFYLLVDKTIQKASGGKIEGQDPISIINGVKNLFGGK